MPVIRVLITGARGFIGSHLASHLFQAGHKVCGLGHGLWPEQEARQAGVWPWINGEVSAANLSLLQKAAGSPDVIFHLAGGSSVGAAIANPREDFSRTVTSTAELLEWVRQAAPQARLIVVSSAAVYGAGHEGPIAEDGRLSPYSPYGRHKLMMEQLCTSYAETYGVDACIARLFSVYGPGLRKQLLWDLCSRLSNRESPVKLGGTGEELRDWTHVDDVARALRHYMDLATPTARVLNIGTGRATNVREVAVHIARRWADGGDSTPITFSGVSRPGDPFSLISDCAALSASGFKWKLAVEQGMADYVRWFRTLAGNNA